MAVFQRLFGWLFGWLCFIAPLTKGFPNRAVMKVCYYGVFVFYTEPNNDSFTEASEL